MGERLLYKNPERWAWHLQRAGVETTKSFATFAAAERWGNKAQSSVRAFNRTAGKRAQNDVKVVRHSKRLEGGRCLMTIRVVQDVSGRVRR